MLCLGAAGVSLAARRRELFLIENPGVFGLLIYSHNFDLSDSSYPSQPFKAKYPAFLARSAISKLLTLRQKT
jgi:hypothetical protein